MTSLRDRLKTIEFPWFFRKKFLAIFGIIVFALLAVSLYFCYDFYQIESQRNLGLRWKEVTRPLMLPAIPLMIYACIVGLWLIIKLKEIQRNMIGNIPTVFQTQEIALNDGEMEYTEVNLVPRNSPAEMPKMGVFRITNQRMMHTQTISVKRVGALIGLDEPDLTFSIPLETIRQCGFGLDEKRPEHFAVITNTGETHTFGAMKTHNVESAIDKLGWKKTRIDTQVYWIR